MKKIRIGLIGCGNISFKHFQAIKSNEHAELVAVSDIIFERAKKTGIEYNVDYYSDNSELLKRTDIDLVSICTPISTHPSIAIEILNSGKHVLSEKPFGINLDEIDSAINLSKKLNKKIFVVHQVRYNKTIQEVKKLIDMNKLGKIYSYSLNVRWFRPESYFSKNWYGSKKIAGGTLLNQGIHYLDILYWFAGMPSSVICFSGNLRYKKIGVDDYNTGLMLFDKGRVCNFEINVLTYDKNKESTLLILAEKGTIEISGMALNEFSYWAVENMDKPEIDSTQQPISYKTGEYFGSVPNHYFVYKDIIDELNGEKINVVSASEARNSIKLALSLYASAIDNKWIKL